jgi:hypothetical protein
MEVAAMEVAAVDVRALADRLEIIEVCTRHHWCVDHRDDRRLLEWSGRVRPHQ